MPYEFLNSIRLHPGSGGLRILSEDETRVFVKDLRTFNRTTGVICRTDVAMFRDEAEALAKAFDRFRNQAVSIEDPAP
jgi:hypothetical protein